MYRWGERFERGWRELANPDWFRGRWFKDDQDIALVDDDQGAIQELPDMDARFSVAGAIRAWRDLQPLSIERDGIVVVHSAPMLEAEDVIKM